MATFRETVLTEVKAALLKAPGISDLVPEWTPGGIMFNRHNTRVLFDEDDDAMLREAMADLGATRVCLDTLVVRDERKTTYRVEFDEHKIAIQKRKVVPVVVNITALAIILGCLFLAA